MPNRARSSPTAMVESSCFVASMPCTSAEPFELYADPGKDWNFSQEDAERMAALGFNVVRLGVIWEGLEPGTLGPNNPAICSAGPAHDPHQFDAAVASAYLAKVAKTVELLGKYHIYTLLDMHKMSTVPNSGVKVHRLGRCALTPFRSARCRDDGRTPTTTRA